MKSIAKLAIATSIVMGVSGIVSSAELELPSHAVNVAKQTQQPSSYILQSHDIELAVDAVSRLGASIDREFPIINAISATLTPEQAKQLETNSQISIQEDASMVTMSTFQNQRTWHVSESDTSNNHIVQMINAAELHKQHIMGQGVTIAIIDSGVNLGGKLGSSLFRNVYNHVKVPKKYDATRSRVTYWWNDDANGHGTHVASIIGSSFKSEGYYNGIAPNAQLLPIKAFDNNGKGRYSTVLDALNWIYNNHQKYNIKVVNMSIGAPAKTRYWQDPINQAVKALWDKGVVIVASAGNNGREAGITVPGNNPYVITVGAAAMDRFDCQAVSFSGNDSQIRIPHNNRFAVRSGAISFWFKYDQRGRNQTLFSKDANGRAQGGHVFIEIQDNGVLRVRQQDAKKSMDLWSGSPLETNKWHHVVFSFGTKGSELYVNGNRKGGHPNFKIGLNTNREHIVIGASSARRGTGNNSLSNITDHLKGAIDEIKIHKKQPNSQEIYRWAQQDKPVASSLLVADWNANACPADENRLVDSINGHAGVMGAGADYIEEGQSLRFSDARIASFSAQGPTLDGFIKPEIVAPGTNVAVRLNTGPLNRTLKKFKRDNRYSVISGTSQAAAVMSGVAALVYSRNTHATPDDVKCTIMASAKLALDDNGKPISPFKQGAGLVDAQAAVMNFKTGCANKGLDIKKDLAGEKHFLGPADRDSQGNFFIRLSNGTFLTHGAHWSNGDLSLHGAHWSNGDLSMHGAHWSNGDMALQGAHWSNGDMKLQGAHWSSGDIKMLGAHWSSGDMALLGAHWSNGDFSMQSNEENPNQP